jgi:hypothetical protein
MSLAKQIGFQQTAQDRKEPGEGPPAQDQKRNLEVYPQFLESTWDSRDRWTRG